MDLINLIEYDAKLGSEDKRVGERPIVDIAIANRQELHCENERRINYNTWCGVSNVTTHFN